MNHGVQLVGFFPLDKVCTSFGAHSRPHASAFRDLIFRGLQIQ